MTFNATTRFLFRMLIMTAVVGAFASATAEAKKGKGNGRPGRVYHVTVTDTSGHWIEGLGTTQSTGNAEADMVMWRFEGYYMETTVDLYEGGTTVIDRTNYLLVSKNDEGQIVGFELQGRDADDTPYFSDTFPANPTTIADGEFVVSVNVQDVKVYIPGRRKKDPDVEVGTFDLTGSINFVQVN